MNKPSSCGRFKLPLLPVLRGRAQAAASIAGSEHYPDISGVVRFYQTGEGVIVWAEVSGLPRSGQPCGGQVFGFHIHKGSGCGGNMDDPFADALSPAAVSIRTTPGICRRCLETTDSRCPCF